ncbi:MAG: GDSL-type esterase/lipase family protein [Treponema sp.]|jgi:acyl-CoA thioesterase-1|nr:GDSL-type esterase/lipase family protein [Treponema sp.]
MKKSVFSLGIIGIIIGLFFIGCDNGSTNNNNAPTLVCFGNSLTAGYGATTAGIDDKANSYPAYLQNRVSIPVINAGISGNTTLQALVRINNDVLSKNPLIVIVELGANDVFRRVLLDSTRDNLQKIIALLDDGNRKIYIAKFYTEVVAREMLHTVEIDDYAYQTAIINRYDDMFNALAESNNVELIDDIWKGVWGIHMSDAVHPNKSGYEIMANNYYDAIKPYLEANNLLK